MPGAVIVVNQPGGAGAGSPGVSRRDLWKSQQIQLVVGTGGNSSQEWALLDIPPGSASSLTNPSSTTSLFTPDVRGSYRIQLVTNGGGPGNVAIMTVRVRFTFSGDPDGLQYVTPALGESAGESNYVIGGVPNARDWAQVFEEIISDVETAISSLSSSIVQRGFWRRDLSFISAAFTPQYLTPGSDTTNTGFPGVTTNEPRGVLQVPGSVSKLRLAFIGDASNNTGQTVLATLYRAPAATPNTFTAVPGAVTAAFATDGTSVGGTVSFTPVVLSDGDVLAVSITISADLTTSLTGVMASASG